jgi:hypothetical protein
VDPRNDGHDDRGAVDGHAQYAETADEERLHHEEPDTQQAADGGDGKQEAAPLEVGKKRDGKEHNMGQKAEQRLGDAQYMGVCRLANRLAPLTSLTERRERTRVVVQQRGAGSEYEQQKGAEHDDG